MVQLYVQVKPGARSNSHGFDKQGNLWMRIAAPALENKANEAATVYLAYILAIRKGTVRLIKRQTSRIKCFEVDLQQPELARKLVALR